MQIHELNRYDGNLDLSAFVAVDNGNDTGKCSVTELLRPVSDEVDAANTRIDNIIAGGDAPSEAEIIDARKGADNVIYSSLGTAIRNQIQTIQNQIGVEYTEIDSVSRNETTYSNNYIALTTPMKSGRLYRVGVKLSGFTAELLNRYSDQLGLYSSQGSTGLVENLTIEIDENDVFVYALCVPNGDVNYVKLTFNSAFVGTSGTYSYVTVEEITNTVEENKKALDENALQIQDNTYIVDLNKPYNLFDPNQELILNSVILPSDGSIITNSSWDNAVTDYIEIDPDEGYICNSVLMIVRYYDKSSGTYKTSNIAPYSVGNFAFFDENKEVIPFTGTPTAVSKPIPENAKYIRLCLLLASSAKYARLIYGNYSTRPILRQVAYNTRQNKYYKEPNTGYEDFKMVMFGDSITHGDLGAGDQGISYVDYMGDYLHADIVNVGFGGTRMTYTLNGAGLFCFYHLCECIASDDSSIWDALDNYAETEQTYQPHLATLKAIDWESVDAIGLMYGANDFTSNTPVGSAYNEDISNYDGACAYGLSVLLNKYPHLQVIVFAPFYREMTLGDPTTGTDTTPNAIGLYMRDYGEALKNIQPRLHVPVIQSDSLFNVNRYSIKLLSWDGTHPRTDLANKRLGHLFANMVKTYISPV